MNCDVPIIVGGCHRSGTTLVRTLLNRHPNIFCPSEIKFHMDLLRQFPSDPLKFARLGSTIDALGLDDEVWLQEFGKAMVRCYELATLKAGKLRWADKSPENAINVSHWNRLLLGRFRFILVVRHPLDVLSSIAETPMSRVLPADTVGRAEHIRRFMESGAHFCASNPSISTVVRYEDIIHKTEATLTRLFSDLGEDYCSQILNSFSSADTHAGLGDPKAISYTGISSESVGRWRHSLSQESLARAIPLLDSVMRKFYPEGSYEF